MAAAPPSVATTQAEGGADAAPTPGAACWAAPDEPFETETQQLTLRTVTKTLAGRRSSLMKCFLHDGQEEGVDVSSIVIGMEITSAGAVSAVSVEPARVQASALGQCVSAVVQGIRFPAHSEPLVTFKVPMRLQR